MQPEAAYIKSGETRFYFAQIPCLPASRQKQVVQKQKTVLFQYPLTCYLFLHPYLLPFNSLRFPYTVKKSCDYKSESTLQTHTYTHTSNLQPVFPATFYCVSVFYSKHWLSFLSIKQVWCANLFYPEVFCIAFLCVILSLVTESWGKNPEEYSNVVQVKI